MTTVWAIRAARVYTPHQCIDDGGVLIEGERVSRVGRWSELNLPPGIDVRDVRPHFLSAGFIDLHVHGAVGHDFMDAGDEDFEAICRWHAQGGTTSLLATTCAAPIDDIERALNKTAEWQTKSHDGARVLGAHVEGPFFNMQMRGCHLPEFVKFPSAEDVTRLLDHRDVMRHMTIAPEIDGALEAIQRFAEAGVSVAVAHSNATSDDMDAAMPRGLRHVTHLFNAMSIYHQRGPNRMSGVVEVALARDELTAELIADGLHVNPTRMKLAVKAKGVSRLCLVTDAMRGAGMPDGLYAFGPRNGKLALVRDGVAVMPEGTGFASSTIPMIRGVQVMTQQVGVSLPDALMMANANPATVIGVAQRKGELREGMDADLVVLDDQLRVRMTVVEGRIVFSDPENHRLHGTESRLREPSVIVVCGDAPSVS